MSNLVIDNCNISTLVSSVQSNNLQLKEMSQILAVEHLQPVYIHKCQTSKLTFLTPTLGHNTDGFDVSASNLTIENWFVGLITYPDI